MNANSLARYHIGIIRDYAPNLPEATVRKHLILQILVNLIRNAQKSCCDAGAQDKTLTLRLGCNLAGRRIQIEVQDNGVGIPPENLSRLFSHGFTTRKDGHGFGLHSGVRMAEEMGVPLPRRARVLGRGPVSPLYFPASRLCRIPAKKRWHADRKSGLERSLALP